MPQQSLRQDRGVTIPLVMPYSMLEQLNAMANDSGCNRSALIREAITVALFTGEGEIPTASPTGTTRTPSTCRTTVHP